MFPTEINSQSNVFKKQTSESAICQSLNNPRMGFSVLYKMISNEPGSVESETPGSEMEKNQPKISLPNLIVSTVQRYCGKLKTLDINNYLQQRVDVENVVSSFITLITFDFSIGMITTSVDFDEWLAFVTFDVQNIGKTTFSFFLNIAEGNILLALLAAFHKLEK